MTEPSPRERIARARGVARVHAVRFASTTRVRRQWPRCDALAGACAVCAARVAKSTRSRGRARRGARVRVGAADGGSFG